MRSIGAPGNKVYGACQSKQRSTNSYFLRGIYKPSFAEQHICLPGTDPGMCQAAPCAACDRMPPRRQFPGIHVPALGQGRRHHRRGLRLHRSPGTLGEELVRAAQRAKKYKYSPATNTRKVSAGTGILAIAAESFGCSAVRTCRDSGIVKRAPWPQGPDVASAPRCVLRTDRVPPREATADSKLRARRVRVCRGEAPLFCP